MPPAKMKGQVLLTLEDGRELVLVMNHAALFEAEQAGGQPLWRLMAQAKLGFLGPMRAFLFGALQARHPEITLEEASAIALRELEAVTEAVGKAIAAAFPEAGDAATGSGRAEGKKDANPPHARPGPSSGGSGAKRASSPKASGKRHRAATR